MEGQVRIYHEDNLWINDGVMKVVGQESIEIRNRYEVIPWEEGQELTTWVSVNPGLGVLEGTFTITDDCIISAYKAERRVFGCRGFDPGQCGPLFKPGSLVYKGKEKLSSWSVELNRVQNLQAY